MGPIPNKTLVISPEWMHTNYCPGARCAECKTEFTQRAPAAGIACLRNGAGGNNWYPLCGTCGIAYNTLRRAGIPNCAADAAIFAKCAGRCKTTFTADNPAVVIASTPNGECLFCASCFDRLKVAQIPALVFTLILKNEMT
jgi:hypothetical protein